MKHSYSFTEHYRIGHGCWMHIISGSDLHYKTRKINKIMYST